MARARSRSGLRGAWAPLAAPQARITADIPIQTIRLDFIVPNESEEGGLHFTSAKPAVLCYIRRMLDRKWLLNFAKAVTGIIIGIPAVAGGYYCLYKVVTWIGN